jgi:flagellin-like protein
MISSAGKRGVTSVIGILLIVAITVILAAVVATFALGIGEDTQQTTPQVSFAVAQEQVTFQDASAATNPGATNTTTVVKFTLSTGDPVDRSNLDLLVNGERNGWDPAGMGTESDGTTSDGTARRPVSSATVPATLEGGDTIRVVFADSGLEDGNTVTISATTGVFNDQGRPGKPAIIPLKDGDEIMLRYDAPESSESAILRKYTVDR